MHAWHPSRRAAVHEEALRHFLANYNEKVVLSDQDARGGQVLDYLSLLYSKDLRFGGLIPDIVCACGLAGMSNLYNDRKLQVAARKMQNNVMRELKKRLSHPTATLTDSSVLTCLLLAAFEVRSAYQTWIHTLNYQP